MAQTLTSVREVEREIASLRSAPGTDAPYQRTSVMTHVAWVPEEWVEAAEDVLTGLAERHPSRTIVLFPRPTEDDGLDGDVQVECYPAGEGRQICTETIRIHLNGRRAAAPASVVEPLLLPDLPAFLRWRGLPSFGEAPFEGLIDVVDRLIVDSTEWPEPVEGYRALAEIFDRVVVSDIAWARTNAWRVHLASLWPEIGSVRRIGVTGTAAQAHLLAGWLRTRLGHEVAVEHEHADRLEGVVLDGDPAPFPPGDPPAPADVLSDELDMFDRDRIYEEAVRGALA